MAPYRIGVCIPCYNVEETISKVLRSFSAEVLERVDEILVIDNASNDQTVPIVRRILSSNSPMAQKLRLIQQPSNLGYGNSIKTGFSYFLEGNKTHIIIVHGDNQADANILVREFTDELLRNDFVDLVVGSRFKTGSDIGCYSLPRTWGNQFFNAVTKLVSGVEMSDAGSGIICVRTDLLRHLPYERLCGQYHFHPELNLLIYRNKDFNVVEIPMKWSDSEAGSHLKVVRYAAQLLRILFVYAFESRLLGRDPVSLFERHCRPRHA